MDPIMIPGLVSMGGQLLNNLTAPMSQTTKSGGSFASALEKAEETSPARKAKIEAATETWMERISSFPAVQEALPPQMGTPASWQIGRDGSLRAVYPDRSTASVPLSPAAKTEVREIYEEAAGLTSTVSSATASSSEGGFLEISRGSILSHTSPT